MSWPKAEPSFFGVLGVSELEKRCDLSHLDLGPDDQGFDALYYAIKSLKVDNISFLLARGANVKRSSSCMNPPLIQVILTSAGYEAGRFLLNDNKKAIFEQLVAAGADPFQRDKKGNSLLMHACGTVFFSRCLEFYKSGTCPNKENLFNIVLVQAFNYSDFKAIIELKKLGAVLDQPLGYRNMRIDARVLIELVDSIKDPCLSWSNLCFRGSPGVLTVFFLGANDVPANVCSTCNGLAPFCVVCRDFSDAGDFIMENQQQFKNLSSAKPLQTAERRDIGERSLYILTRFGLDQCIGMQALGLPALVTTEILQALLGKKWPKIAFYFYHTFAVTIKHFLDEPSKRRGKE